MLRFFLPNLLTLVLMLVQHIMYRKQMSCLRWQWRKGSQSKVYKCSRRGFYVVCFIQGICEDMPYKDYNYASASLRRRCFSQTTHTKISVTTSVVAVIYSDEIVGGAKGSQRDSSFFDSPIGGICACRYCSRSSSSFSSAE